MSSCANVLHVRVAIETLTSAMSRTTTNLWVKIVWSSSSGVRTVLLSMMNRPCLAGRFMDSHLWFKTVHESLGLWSSRHRCCALAHSCSNAASSRATETSEMSCLPESFAAGDGPLETANLSTQDFMVCHSLWLMAYDEVGIARKTLSPGEHAVRGGTHKIWQDPRTQQGCMSCPLTRVLYVCL